MSSPVAPSSVVFGGAWLTSPLLSLRHPCKSPASRRLLASLVAWQNTKMPLAPRATSATRPLSPRPRNDDLEVEPQQRSYGRQRDRKLALLRFVFTPRERHEIIPLPQEPCQRQRASIHKARPSRRFVDPFKYFKYSSFSLIV
ncbi:hypothetical protein Q7P35_005970 [Cladosporium inversicolor]